MLPSFLFKFIIFRIELNETAISIEERETVNEMKSGKSPGPDRFPVECLKKGGRQC